ncbi:MAG: hypothetical protein ABFR62_03895 [Bacteroidota bacterium]
MKKLIKFIALALIFVASSCEKPDYKLPDNVMHVAFEGRSSTLTEGVEITEIVGLDTLVYDVVDTVRIPVYLTTNNKDLNVSVEFSFDSTAVEGEHFIVLNKDDFRLDGTDVYNYLEIVTIDNDVVGGDKVIEINIANISNSDVNIGIGGVEANTHIVDIIDDEHPLAHLFGTYNVEGYSNRFEETSTWESTFLPVRGSNTELDIRGFWEGFDYNDIRASVDLEANTFTIKAGQVIATDETYGKVYVVYVEVIDGERVVDTKRDIVGTINADGTVTISKYGFYVNSAAATGFFDWFGTTTYTKN